jgi:protein SCO1/2
MNESSNRSVVERLATRASAFLAGGLFPAFALCLLLFYQLFVALMAFVPDVSLLGNFVEDFRVRCFQYNPENGWMRLSSVWTMLAEPVPLQLILFYLWRAPLHELWRMQRRALWPSVGGALLTTTVLVAGLFNLDHSRPPTTELPFPADRLRSALPMPAFTLTNQEDQAVSLTDFKGQVVLITAVYSTCTRTCPMMLTKIRTVLDELTPTERRKLAVVAFSLNPDADTRELRVQTAKIYGMEAPRFHFVNGLPGEVNALLDKLNFSRSRDEKTGEITHANLFLLLDREGHIAYRLSLSQQEQSWLIAALRVLLAESAPHPGSVS